MAHATHSLRDPPQAWSYPEHSSGIRPPPDHSRKTKLPVSSAQTPASNPNPVPPPGSQAAQEAWGPHQRLLADDEQPSGPAALGQPHFLVEGAVPPCHQRDLVAEAFGGEVGGRAEHGAGPVPHLQERLREGGLQRGRGDGGPGSQVARTPRGTQATSDCHPHTASLQGRGGQPHSTFCTKHTHVYMHTHTTHTHHTQTHACTCAHRRTTHRPQSPGRRGRLEPITDTTQGRQELGLSDDNRSTC